VNELSKKILESGLVDEATARMMEKWGILDEGAADLAKKSTLKDATREQLMKFADDVGEEVDKQRRLKETMLDLNQLKWPAFVGIFDPTKSPSVVHRVTALVDRMNRYYFRPQDAAKEWFVPGGLVLSGPEDKKQETILEVTELFIGDQVAAIQVSVQ
jgi:hypothetical protein